MHWVKFVTGINVQHFNPLHGLLFEIQTKGLACKFARDLFSGTPRTIITKRAGIATGSDWLLK